MYLFGHPGNVTLTLNVTHGTVTLSTEVTGGLTASQITGNDSSSVTVVAPLAAINSTLAAASGLTYTPTSNYNGLDTLSLASSDALGNLDTSSVAITVAGPLTITAPPRSR